MQYRTKQTGIQCLLCLFLIFFVTLEGICFDPLTADSSFCDPLFYEFSLKTAPDASFADVHRTTQAVQNVKNFLGITGICTTEMLGQKPRDPQLRTFRNPAGSPFLRLHADSLIVTEDLTRFLAVSHTLFETRYGQTPRLHAILIRYLHRQDGQKGMRFAS